MKLDPDDWAGLAAIVLFSAALFFGLIFGSAPADAADAAGCTTDTECGCTLDCLD